ncbi:MAG: insulinase family protein [Planctomycetes bacterium]|nr:insulinase family protein [Planctomycetota bacterium]
MADPVHFHLDCGVEVAVLELPHRRAIASEIRMLTGVVDEPADKLGLAHLVEQTLDKGTDKFDGRQLQDAFDEIGTGAHTWCGKQACGFTSLCLPEYYDRSMELHAAFLRTPTFPQESCDVAVELARQELLTLEDDAQGLADKFMGKQSMGPLLGRHSAGEVETLSGTTRNDFVEFWRSNYGAGRMQICVAGPVTADQVKSAVERHFAGFGESSQTHREPLPVEFSPVTTHHEKETEQEHIIIALRSVPKTDNDYAAARLLLGVLSGGMSARLFTEIREKQGLVYWVGGWQECPRGAGLMYFGASTTPERCQKTYDTLLSELDRVQKDVTEEEIERARTGIEVRTDIRGDVTRALCGELADDLTHYGKPVPLKDKLAKLRAIKVADIQRFCEQYVHQAPRSVVTLGPAALSS